MQNFYESWNVNGVANVHVHTHNWKVHWLMSFCSEVMPLNILIVAKSYREQLKKHISGWFDFQNTKACVNDTAFML